MASGTIDFTQSATSGSYIDGKIVWTSTVVDVTKRWSSLNVKLYVRKDSTDTTLTIPTEGTWSYNLTINGQTYTGTNSKDVLKDWVEVISYTIPTILHNTDGSKSIVISGSVTAPAGTSFAGHKSSGSGTAKLDTIPQATTIDSLTCSSVDVTGTITAKYTPKSATYYNRRIVSVYGSNAWVNIHTKDLGQQSASQQTHTLKFDANELAKIYSTVTSAIVKVRVVFQTFLNSGYSTQVGANQSLTIELSLPSVCNPTASLTVTRADSNSWITSKNIYVAGLSSVTVKLTATPGEGASLKSAKAFYDNIGFNADTPTTFKLNKSGNIEFTAQVTNSRGQSASASKSIAVLPYSSPAVASMQTERGTYNNSWTADENGQDVRVSFKTTLALTDKGNTYNAAFKVDGTSKTPNHGATTGLTSGADCVVYFIGLSGDVSHTLTLTTTDSTGSTGAATLSIPTARVTIEFGADGVGIAFGKTSEKDAFECAWPAEFYGDVSIGGSVSIDGKELDIIVEQGTSAINHTVDGVTARSGTWYYRKWSSGIMECWGIGNVNVKVNMTWSGTGLYYGVVSTINFPFAFTEIPVCTVDVAYGNQEKSLVVASCGRGTNVYARPIMLCRNTSETVNCDLHYHAIGRWK